MQSRCCAWLGSYSVHGRATVTRNVKRLASDSWASSTPFTRYNPLCSRLYNGCTTSCILYTRSKKSVQTMQVFDRSVCWRKCRDLFTLATFLVDSTSCDVTQRHCVYMMNVCGWSQYTSETRSQPPHDVVLEILDSPRRPWILEQDLSLRALLAQQADANLSS